MRHSLLVLGLSSALTLGCTSTSNLGSSGDTGPDARAAARVDECGNGIDDDGNGRIDDRCPCAPGETQRCTSGPVGSFGVGACRAGTQVCVVLDGEWGDWGDGGCSDEVRPVAERCDGSDADCDGAIDEGCPCTSDTTRGCGEEFLIAPCMAGTQTCRGGSWSACEGAIGPTSDVCTDTVDNDCDGTTNEGCSCPVPPSPERCRDGVDNDCDGMLDEPECTPDYPADAGMPDGGTGPVDAGPSSSCGTFSGPSCTPVTTSITSYGTNEIALASAGCEYAVSYAQQVGSELEIRMDRFDTSGTRLSSTVVERRVPNGAPTTFLAHGPSGWALLYGPRNADSPYEMRRTLAFFDADGNLVGAPVFVGSSLYTALRSGHLFWDGARWVAIWWDMDESRNVTAHAAFVDPSTRLFTSTAQPMVGEPQLDGADWNGTELLVPVSVGAAGTDVALQTFDAAFSPVASVSLPISPARTVSVAWTGSDWQLAWESGEGTGVVPHPVRRARVTPGLALAESPEIVFPDVGYPANTVSLAVDGAHVGVGAGFSGVSTPPIGTYARFGRGDLGPVEDLRPFGALRTGAPASEVRVEVAPRRAVVWNERGTGDDGARLILLCEP